jgi:hypothetical protein
MIRTIIFLLLLAPISGMAQEEDLTPVERSLEARQFVFEASQVIPSGRPSRSLNYGYRVEIKGDSLISYLPYFGRAYSTSIGNETKSALDFTSVKFSFEVDRKKKRWDITIKPEDYPEVQQMIFSIGSDGFASLSVIPSNRQQIRFNGNVKPVEKK